MSAADSIQTILAADTGSGGVATLLTGGIYTYPQTGRLGINSRYTPAAFDPATKKLKPCAIVKERAKVPDYSVVDTGSGSAKASYSQVVEIYLYCDGDADGSVILSAAERCFRVLHGVRIDEGVVHWQHTIVSERDEALNNAHLGRIDFEVYGVAS